MNSPQIIIIVEIFKGFSPANLSSPQTIIIPELLKEVSTCKIVLAAFHQYPGNIQQFPCLQICRSHISSKSWAKKRLFHLQNCLGRKSAVSFENYKLPGNIQRLFRPENCLSRKSLISRKF